MVIGAPTTCRHRNGRKPQRGGQRQRYRKWSGQGGVVREEVGAQRKPWESRYFHDNDDHDDTSDRMEGGK